jgi:uncharacterized protein YjiS (DUF1127 family)
MFESLKCKWLNFAEKYSRIKTLQILERMPDRQLEDAGLCAALVRGGIEYYPWRVNEPAIPLPNHKPKHKTVGLSRRELRRAEAELRALTNKELADLGLSRGNIPYAVRYGVA